MSLNLLEISHNVTSQFSIQHDGPINIKGNVDSGATIIAKDDIQIKGDVSQAIIKSINGSINIKGGLKGAGTHCLAGKDISVHFVYNLTLRANNNIYVREIAMESHMTAKNSIYMDSGRGLIEGGEIEAGKDIVANVIGNDKSIPTTLRIINFKQAEIYSVLSRYEKEGEALKKEISETEKLIEVIRLLGNKVVMLPLEKKQDLVSKIKKFDTLQAELAELEIKKNQLFQFRPEQYDLDRAIIANQILFIGTAVYMDNAKLFIQENFKKVILYKKGIIIIGDFDDFMRRKKYSNPDL